uniref:winged helix-turn-helix domain-containing protein n=1 Tax=Ningiella ruwaisensis TaxID=2364274 RepID=UPI00109F7E56|nr:transcriptional regulator [Ningiella ruwaisensis]
MTVTIQIANWHINPDDRSVTHTETGVVKHLEPKTMSVLLVLIEREGQVVSREEFMQRVWSGSFTVEESLTRCISELRKVFNDKPKDQQFIKTVHGKGYQLLVGTMLLSESNKKSANQTASSPKMKQYTFMTMFCLLALALFGAWAYVESAADAQDKQAPAEKGSTKTISNKPKIAEHNIAQRLLSIEELPSTLRFTGNTGENAFEINFSRPEQGNELENIVDIEVKSDGGLPIWQGSRKFSTEAERMLAADDLSSILAKAAASKKAPEIDILSENLQAQYQHALYLIDRRGKKNLNKAIEILEQLVSQRSDFVMGFVQLAVAARSLSLYETDFESRRKYLIKYELLLKQAKAIAPEHPVVNAILYEFNLSAPNFDDYEKVLKSAVEYAPACVICVRELAELYLHLGYFQKAAQVVESSIDYFPLSVFMHSYLAIIYSHQGNTELLESQAHIIEALGQDRGFDALSINMQVAMMKGDMGSYLDIRKDLLKQHPAYDQHLQVHDALIAMNYDEAKSIVASMPLLDFNLGMSVGKFDELLARINRNLNNGSIRDLKFIHGYLMPDSYLFNTYSKNLMTFQNSEEVLALFNNTGMLAYWQKNNRWPDYCWYDEYYSQRPSYCFAEM